MDQTELIVMLTYNDYTVKNAMEIFQACKDAPVQYWGAKEAGISRQELKELYAAVKAAGKSAVLEVVAYTESACIDGAKVAVECGCDLLLGTKYFDSVSELCRSHNIRYMPFVGSVSGRPSVLEGSAEETLAQLKQYQQKGVYGVDLLGYRYIGNIQELCQKVIDTGFLPVCLAGSINSTKRLDEVRALHPAYFTIGSAFFDGCFGNSIPEQIAFVCDYMRK